MSDDLPSATPKKSDNEKAARGEHNGKPDGKFKLTQLEWGGFFGDIFVILWVWSDIIACHDFNRLVFLFFALVVAHGVLCLFISKIFNSWRLALVVWVLSCVPAAWIACKNSRPEPLPHFKLSVFTDDNFDKSVELTNSFLFSPNGESGDFKFRGVLCVPTQLTQSNIFLNLVVFNDFHILSEDVEIGVAVSTNLNCVLSNNWKPTMQRFLKDSDPDSMKMQSWGTSIPAIHPNDGVDCKLLLKVTRSEDWGIIAIMMEAKGFAKQVLPFHLVFIPTNDMPFQKPFMILAKTNSAGKMEFGVSKKELNELQK